MIKELLPTEPVDMLQQGDPVVQAPKQDPPYKKKVYDKLVSSFEDFKLSEDDFYKKLVSDKTYAARVHKVLLDNFEDFTKPSDKFVADITFEEPLKKKDSTSGISLQNVQASSQAPQVDVAAGLSTLIPTKSPSASQEKSDIKIDLNLDPVTLARKSKKIETGNEDAYSAQLNKLGYKDDFISNIKDLPEGYEKSQYYGTDILANDYQVNPLRFQRKVASLKWQAPLASVIQDRINQVRKTNLPDTEKQDKISQLLSDNKRWAYLNESKDMNEIDKQDAFKEKKAFIYKYIDDEKTQNKLIDNLRTDSSINFGGETDIEKFKYPEGGNFNTRDYIAMNYLEKTDPSKADFYYRTLFNVDKNEVNKSNLTSNAYNKLKRELSEIGINLVYNNAKEKYDDLVEKGNKNNGILSDSDFEKLEKYGAIVKNSSLEYDNLKNEYGDADDEDLEINAQEAAGQRSNTPSTLAKILFGAFVKSGSSIAKIVKAPFQDDKSSNLDLLEAAGLEDALAESANLTSDKSIYNNSELRMSPALQARVNAIKSDKSLSQDEIVDKTKELFKQNKDQWKRVAIEGKFNITPKSVSTSIVKLITELAPYLTLEAASAGTATPSVLSAGLKTLSFVTATSYQDALANAVKNKDANPERTALIDIAINTAAIEAGGVPSKIRAKLAKSSVGEAIAKLSDKEIASLIKPSKLSDYIANSVTKSGKAVVSSLKSTVPMQAAFAAGDILKGADVNSEFAKEQVASLLSFTGLGAITGMIGKDAKRENNTKDAFYLAGKNGDAILEYVDKQVSNGKMSEKNAEAIIENVEKANEVYSKLPEKDAKGNSLTERQKSDILYSTIKSEEKQVKAEEAPLAEEQVIETPLAKKPIEKPVEPIIETETIAKPTELKESKPIEAKVEAKPIEQKMEVKPTEVKVETEKPYKEVVFTAHGTGDNGYVIEHAQGIEKKDVKRLEDARSVVTEQVGLNNEQKAELENTGSLITENKILENGDKKITVHFKNRDAFGRKGGSRFDLVIPENNASTAEGIKKVVDNFYTENEALGGKTLEGSKYIQESVRRVQKYLDTNKAKLKPIEIKTEVKPAEIGKQTEIVESGSDLILSHGTKHDFDKFQLEKIGTGEGAQAFGYGLYFTDGSKIAEGYAKKLSEDNTGLVYSVKIKNGKLANWAEWRRPLDESIESSFYDKLTKEEKTQYQDYVDNQFNSGKDKNYTGSFGDLELSKEGFLEYPTFEKPSASGNLYQDLKSAFGQEKATEIFKRAGIDGIKYESQGGYGNENNYVVFNPESIEVIKKSKGGAEVKPTEEISLQKAEVKFTEAKARYERARGKESKSVVDKLKDEAINAKSELDDIRNKTKVQEGKQAELKPVEKAAFKSSQGHTVELKNGKLVVKDKNQEALSDRASRKAIEEYAENFDYSKGDKAPEVPSEITNSRDAAKYVVEESSNPIEIAEIYASEDLLPKESNAKFQAIAEYGLGRIKTSSYKNLGDPNKIEKSMYLKIFSEERGTPIDVLAKSISDKYEGLNIEPQDIVDYIEKYSKGDKGALEFKESDVALQAADKFNKLTGLDLNSELANKVIDNKLGKANKDQLEIIKQDYETAKQLEDAYWAEYKKTDGFTKESNISKVNKPEPAKEPSKKLEEAYKDLTNIEKRQIINSKFEELLKELKIEKICPTD